MENLLPNELSEYVLLPNVKNIFADCLGSMMPSLEVIQEGWFRLEYPITMNSVILNKKLSATVYVEVHVHNMKGALIITGPMGFYVESSVPRSQGILNFEIVADSDRGISDFRYSRNRSAFALPQEFGLYLDLTANFKAKIRQFCMDISNNMHQEIQIQLAIQNGFVF